MDTKAIISGVSAAALFVLAKGQNSSIAVPFLGNFSTPVGGFIHGYVNSMFTDALYPPTKELIKSVYKPEETSRITQYRLDRVTAIGTSAVGQYALLYGTVDANTGLIVGALNNMIRL
jgi:hypothetical protein